MSLSRRRSSWQNIPSGEVRRNNCIRRLKALGLNIFGRGFGRAYKQTEGFISEGGGGLPL